MDPIAHLQHEHTLIDRVLTELERWADAPPETPAREVFTALVAFLSEFVDSLHHAQEEEILFPAVVAHRVGDGADSVAPFHADHKAGRELSQQMGALAALPGPWTGAEHAAAAKAARAYTALLRLHIAYEEATLFPLVLAGLPVAELRRIARAMRGLREGPATVVGYSRLVSAANALVPASPSVPRLVDRATHRQRRSAHTAHTPFDERPFLAIWEVTQACDLACLHCRACATPEATPDELTTAEGKTLLSRLAAIEVPLVVLTGGDPAKRTDLVELVEHGSRSGLSMAVTPSGTPLTTQRLLADLRDAGLRRLAVSIDGPDATFHDGFRGVPGSFRESIRILETARALGIETQINTSIGPQNAARLAEIGNLVAELGAVLWSVFFVVSTGRAIGLHQLTPIGVEALLVELEQWRRRAPYDVKTTAAPQFRRVQMLAHGDPNGVHRDIDANGVVRGPRGINDGCGFVFVSHLGEIFPSGFLPLSTGNVRQDDIADVYRRHPLFVQLRDVDALKGKCGACAFRRVCGGSRARAYAGTGDPLASDPGCSYVPPGYTEQRS